MEAAEILEIMRQPDKWPAPTLRLKRKTQAGILAHYKGYFVFARLGIRNMNEAIEGKEDLLQQLVRDGWEPA